MNSYGRGIQDGCHPFINYYNMNLNIFQKFFLFWVAMCWIIPTPGFAVSSSPAPLHMLVIPMETPSRMYKDFLPLKHYLGKKLNRSIELDVARKNSGIATLFREKKTDIAFVCPTLYCDLTQVISVVPLVKLRINGSDQYRSVLVVRKDSPIKRTADLINRTLVYGRYNCPGSGLLPRIMLQRVGLSNSNFFEVVKLGNDESALLAVMARMFDVTGVPEMAVRSLAGNSLRIIRYSKPIPQYLFVARSGLDKDLISRIKKVMLDLNQAPDRKALIGGIEKGVDGFSLAHDSDYDIVRVLIESLNLGNARSSFRKGEHTLVVEPLYYGADFFWRLKPLLSKLRQETGWNYHLRIPKSIDAFLKIRKQGKGDLYLQESGFLARFRNPGDELLGPLAVVSPEMNVGVIIAASSGKVKDLHDLRGKRIGVPSRLAEGGYMAQTRWLRKRGVPVDTIRLVSLGTYENVLMSVYRGKVDAGYLTLGTLRRLKKDLQPKRIVIIGRTPPLKEWVISARKNVPDFVKNKIRKILAGKDLYPQRN